MEERYGEIYYVTDDERTSIERGLTAIFWVSESPARHLELRQRGARLADAPASGSPSSVCGRGDRLNALTLRRCRWIARTMAESSTITTLRTKRDQIEGLIAHLEDRIKEARTDLAHVNATLRLFEMDGGARVRRDWRGRGRTARRRVAQELVRAIAWLSVGQLRAKIRERPPANQGQGAPNKAEHPVRVQPPCHVHPNHPPQQHDRSSGVSGSFLR